MKLYIRTLKVVLLLAAANSLFWILLPDVLPEFTGNILFNVVRFTLALWAGWLVVTERIGRLWGASLAGAMVFLVDHPIVKGGSFLVEGEPRAFAGVLFSYVMFVWVAMLVALVGGLAGRWRLRHAAN